MHDSQCTLLIVGSELLVEGLYVLHGGPFHAEIFDSQQAAMTNDLLLIPVCALQEFVDCASQVFPTTEPILVENIMPCAPYPGGIMHISAHASPNLDCIPPCFPLRTAGEEGDPSIALGGLQQGRRRRLPQRRRLHGLKSYLR